MSSNPREERFIIPPQIRTIPIIVNFNNLPNYRSNEPLIARPYNFVAFEYEIENSWIQFVFQNNNHKSEDDIKKLFTDNEILMSNNVECSICYENDCDCQTNCEHNYCKECIEKWLLQNNTCPNCRQEIKECNKIIVVDID
jgi:hypothetical protein